jgi:RNA polymerase sigma-70 factor (ECF subfamily)
MNDLDTLLEQARGGDRAAWNALLGRLRPFVRALCRREVRDAGEASDLTQDVLARMDGGFAGFRGTSVPQLLAWVRRITARRLIDRGITRRPAPEALRPEVEDPCGRPPGSRLIDAEEMTRLAAALEDLPEHYRRVIEARLFDGLSCVAVARRLGQTDVWVRVTCKRAVERLHQILRDKP